MRSLEEGERIGRTEKNERKAEWKMYGVFKDHDSKNNEDGIFSRSIEYREEQRIYGGHIE